jgi:hypothetical protein
MPCPPFVVIDIMVVKDTEIMAFASVSVLSVAVIDVVVV